MKKKFNDQELIRRKKLLDLQENNQDPYEIERVARTLTLKEFENKYQAFSKAELLEKELDNEILCGRVLNIRQGFSIIKDFSSSLQIYINKKKYPELFSRYNTLDIGDIISVNGIAMKTNTDQITLAVNDFKIISKSLKVLPEKFHGLVDEEIRARKRYVDLIVNENSMNTFIMRSKIVTLIRNYMDSLGYLEVETPVLQPILGGANARPFVTHHNTLNKEFYLRVATELPLKKLIVGGFEKVYEIGRLFRNEGMDATHNPEFTSMEAYTAYIGMEETMELVEDIIHYVAEKINIEKVNYQDQEINIKAKFKSIHMVDFIKQETGIDFWKQMTAEEAVAIAKKHHVHLEKHQMNYGHVVNCFFEKFCEEKCIQPTFVFGQPIEVSPLAKIDYTDKRFTRRFELFINKKEYANAYAELNDPIDQYNRFNQQVNEKNLGNVEANEIDWDFLEALEYGLPPTGGLGLGIDRLVMLFTNNTSIRNVLLFPHMKDVNK